MSVAGKWAVTGAVLLAALALAFYLNQIDLGTGKHFLPKCTLYSLTGMHCPGCGNTRASQALLRGDIVAAINQNVLFVFALPFLLFGAARIWIHWVFPGRLQALTFQWRRSYSIALILIVVGFGILRNVPRMPFSWLAPVSLARQSAPENPFTDSLSADRAEHVQDGPPSATQ